jgi:hypothetical protein
VVGTSATVNSHACNVARLFFSRLIELALASSSSGDSSNKGSLSMRTVCEKVISKISQETLAEMVGTQQKTLEIWEHPSGPHPGVYQTI